jgi:ABC-type glycerol-3-phosphate transport system substrate-binding protein
LEFDIISSSNNGKYVVSVGSTGCGYYDPATGITTELFDWWDVALTESAAFGEACALVNSNGDFITMDEYSMSRVSKGLVPVKKTLTLASFGDSNYMGYNADDELIDIILAFNSSNSEYKIEIKPMSYSTEDEKNKLLIELATSTDIDLVDTSILPENAINGGVLVDLLPYIDADEDISREDFIEPLLNAMLKNGALYEYTSKYSLLTMFTPAELYPGDENWTAENIKQILADNPGQEAYMHNYDRDDIVKMYTWAAIGEFIDWDSNSCSFDSQAFMDWLTLMRDLPVKQEYSGSDKDLLGISYAAEDEVRYLRYNGYDQYVIAGFPESQTNGCYFVLTGADLNDWMGDSYSGCRIGIMAASSNKDAAWSFVKLLMQGKDRPSLLDGIPVVKASFEKAVDRITRDTVLQGDNFVLFSTEDAKQFKDAVYSTTKMARIDEKLVKLITTEINGYIAGDKTAEDTAAQIQSKVSIYLAEQS